MGELVGRCRHCERRDWSEQSDLWSDVTEKEPDELQEMWG